MNITILAIGKKNDPKIISAIDDFTQRTKHYCKLNWRLVEAKITSGMSIEEIIKNESTVLIANIAKEDTVILLDETGKQLNSPALANLMQKNMNQSIKNIVFIIGGAYGVNQELKNRADLIWALSELVFPHQLVRLILIEQLYRAFTILNNEQYHHD